MNIHEYQAKELLAKFGVPVPAGHAAMSVEDAVRAAKLLPGPLWVVKAQIHAGGRGKGKFIELGPDAKGGVRLAKSLDEVRAARQGNARQHAGDDPDRARGQAGQPPLHHRRRRHRPGILSRLAGRPRQRPHRHGRLDRRRDGHRSGRPRHAREDPVDHHRPRDRLHAAPRPRRRRRARADRRPRQAGRQRRVEAVRRLPRHRCRADRDQPARGHRGRQADGARRQGRRSTATPCSATRTSPSCAT